MEIRRQIELDGSNRSFAVIGYLFSRLSEALDVIAIVQQDGPIDYEQGMDEVQKIASEIHLALTGRKPRLKRKSIRDVELEPKEYAQVDPVHGLHCGREHVPLVEYACGYQNGDDSFRMFDGPFSELCSALECVPSLGHSLPCILQFMDDRIVVLYRWKGNRWVKE